MRRKPKLMTIAQCHEYLCKKTISDWAIVRESIYSCGIEGIWSQRLVNLVNGWLTGEPKLNRKDLHNLVMFFEGKEMVQ